MFLKRPLRWLSVGGTNEGQNLYMSTLLTQWAINLKAQTELVQSRLLVLRLSVLKPQILYRHHSVDKKLNSGNSESLYCPINL